MGCGEGERWGLDGEGPAGTRSAIGHRERQHQDKLGEWGFSGFAFPRGGGDAPSALAGMRDSDQTALAWNPCRLLPEGSPDPGCLASLSHDGGGWEEGSVSPPQPCEGRGGVLSVGPHLDPSGVTSGRGGAGGGGRPEGRPYFISPHC